eukprot:2609914-Prymnesium_polylepis.1
MTLAQVAGIERVKEARAVVDEHVRNNMQQSRQLVDFAADGHVDKMLVELRAFADPDSADREGVTALEAAAGAGHVWAVECLLDFKAASLAKALRKALRAKQAEVLAYFRRSVGVAKLRADGGLAKELKECGFSCEELRLGGLSCAEVRQINFSCAEAREGGFSLAEIKEG